MVGNILIAKLRNRCAGRAAREAEDAPRMLALIEAAEDMFLAKGYHAATMSDVAAAAGMSKKTVYTMIKSKAELFTKLLAHHESLLDFPTPEPGWTTRDILNANLLSLGRFLLSPGQIAILRLIMAEYTHSPDLGRLFVRNRVLKARAKLENCLIELAKKEGCAAGEAKELAAMLFGMAIGEFHLSMLIGYRQAPTRQMLEKRVRRAVDIFMSGCGEAKEVCRTAQTLLEAEVEQEVR
jgi:TetR/AcrR family transcriptional repressor of mexJK operon